MKPEDIPAKRKNMNRLISMYYGDGEDGEWLIDIYSTKFEVIQGNEIAQKNVDDACQSLIEIIKHNTKLYFKK